MNLIKLGIGTTWFGRKWPPNNNNYNAPDFDEIENHFNKVFGMLKNGEMLMIDTAPSYGDSEEKIGRYFKRNPKLIKKSFIATKWGEEFDAKTGLCRIDHSKKQLALSLKRSLSKLPKVDLLYIHRPTADVLNDFDVIQELIDCDIEKIGISISNEKLLERFLGEHLLLILDFIQIPAYIFLTRPDLMERISSHIVLNSPIRKANNISPEEICKKLFNHKDSPIVLTGTRNHLDEVIDIYSKRVDTALISKLP